MRAAGTRAWAPWNIAGGSAIPWVRPVVAGAAASPPALEPPLPAKVTLDQAAKFAKSLLRGEPNSQKIALTVLGDRIRELV